MSSRTIKVPNEAPTAIPILAPILSVEVEELKGGSDVVVARDDVLDFEGEELNLKLVVIVDGLNVGRTLVGVEEITGDSMSTKPRIEVMEQLPLQCKVVLNVVL